jgi:hypothetical protein
MIDLSRLKDLDSKAYSLERHCPLNGIIELLALKSYVIDNMAEKNMSNFGEKDIAWNHSPNPGFRVLTTFLSRQSNFSTRSL